MVEKIVWTKRASTSYWQIIDYLSLEFGDKVVAKFVATVHNKIELIKSNPYLFRKSTSQKNIFITVIHKRTTLTYRYRPVKKQVELLIFWGTRMNPLRNPYKR